MATTSFFANEDTWINSAQATTNHDQGGYTIGYETTPDINRALVRFNFILTTDIISGAALTSGSLVKDAWLRLWVIDNTGGAWTGTANRVTQTGWTEAATYNAYRVGQNWTTPGGDFTTTGAVPFVATGDTTYMTIPGLGPLVQDALLNRSGVLYLLLKGDTESGAADLFATFADSENATASLRPVLTVETGSPSGIRNTMLFPGMRAIGRRR